MKLRLRLNSRWLNGDILITVFFVLYFLIFYTFVCLDQAVLPTLIPLLLLMLLPWFRLYGSILVLMVVTLAVGLFLMSSWFGVDLNTLTLYLNHSVPHIQSMNDGEFSDRIWFCNDEPKEHAHDDLVIIPVHEGVVKLNDDEKVLAVCSEQQEVSLSRNYIHLLNADINKFLPSSQKYLTKHYLDLIILKSIMLEQHYGDLTSPFVSAYTHSDGKKYGLLNSIISDTDFNGFERFQCKTGWIHLNPSYLKYVTRVGYVDFNKPLMYNKVAIMSFAPHKEGIPFDRAVLISGSRDYIDRSIGNLKLAYNLNAFVRNSTEPVVQNKIEAATILKKIKYGKK